MELFLQKVEEMWPTPIDQAHKKTWLFSRWEQGNHQILWDDFIFFNVGELMRFVVKLQQVEARSKHPSMIPEMNE